MCSNNNSQHSTVMVNQNYDDSYDNDDNDNDDDDKNNDGNKGRCYHVQRQPILRRKKRNLEQIESHSVFVVLISLFLSGRHSFCVVRCLRER